MHGPNGERSWQTALKHHRNGAQLSLSRDGKLLLLRSRKEIAILNVATGDTVQSGAVEKDIEDLRDIALLDRNRYLVGTDVFAMRGQLERSLPFKRQWSGITAATSNSGRYVAGFPLDQNVGFVVVDLLRPPAQSLREREAIIQLTLPSTHSVKAAAISNDDQLLAVSLGEAQGRPGELQLLSLQDARSQPIVPQQSRHDDGGGPRAVAPDGAHFATYDREEGLQLWAVGADTPIVTSKVLHDKNSLLAFNPSGTLLAAGSCNGSAALYDARTLRLQYRIRFDGECFAGFSTDGNYLVSRHPQTEFLQPTLHPMTLAGVLTETCAKVTANLTSEEWSRLSPGASPRPTCARK